MLLPLGTKLLMRDTMRNHRGKSHPSEMQVVSLDAFSLLVSIGIQKVRRIGKMSSLRDLIAAATFVGNASAKVIHAAANAAI